MAARENDTALQRVLKCYADRHGNHNKLCQEVQRRYRAFYGMMEENSKAKKWTNKQTPKWAMQISEGVYANLVDDRTRFMVRPRPRVADPEAVRRATEGARALEILLSYQLDVDRFNQKQRNFIMQDIIAGWTVGKVYWKTIEGTRHNITRADTYDADEYGNVTQTRGYDEDSYEDVIFDGPCFETIRVEDFLWEEGSERMQDAAWVIHRSAMSLEELEEKQQQGIYKNISKLKEGTNDSSSDEFNQLQEERTSDKRFKNRIEVWEYWGRDGKLITVANRQVVIREDENPFQHGRYPFVVTQTSPDMFQIPGLSLIDKVSQLQSMLWSLGGQRLDNLELSNNYVLAVQRDIFDAEQLDDLYPGKIIDVSGPVQQSIMQLVPDPMVAQISLAAEEKLVATMQNTTGGFPFMAGVNAGELDQKTATGVSIVTNIAQKMVVVKKMQLAWAYEEIAELFLENDRQFLRDPVLVGIVGADGAAAYHNIEPEALHGFDYHVNVEATTESLMRQERRAENQSLLQMAAQVAPIFAAIAQTDPSKRTLNMEAFMEDVLRSYDKDDFERYFSVKPQPPMPQPGQQQPANGNGQGGVTSPLASNQASPSNQNSMSPEMFMQQMLSQTGRIN